jgi:predicted MFS family arabinose efflux permease
MTHTGLTMSRKLWALVAIVAFVDFVYGATSVTLMQHAQVPAAMIGVLMAAAAIVTSVFEAPSGAWGDRFGQRRVLVAGLVLWGIGQAVFGAAGSSWVFLGALVLWAAGQAFYSGAPAALAINFIRSRYGDDKIPAVVRGAHVVRWGAAGLGAGSVALLGLRVDPGVLVTIAGLVLLPTAVWVWRAWPEQRGNPDRSTTGTLREGLRLAVRGEMAMLAMVTALSGFALAVVILAWQPSLRELGRFSEASFGVFLLVFTILSAIGAWAQRFVEKIDPPVAVALLLMVMGLTFLVSPTGRWYVAGGFLVLEFVIALVLTVTGVWSHALFPDDLRNTLGSLMGTVTTAAMATGVSVFGFLWSGSGLRGALHTTGVAIAVAAGILLAARALHSRRSGRAPAPASLDDILSQPVSNTANEGR